MKSREQTVRVTKEFRFEMAHLLTDYDGLCRNIHGHSYVLQVTVKGKMERNPDSPKNGMVLDFGLLKKIVNEQIVDRLDHSLMIRRATPFAEALDALPVSTDMRIVGVDYQPTCENMVCDFAEKIEQRLPEGVSLCAVRLHETATSYAEWRAEDNL